MPYILLKSMHEDTFEDTNATLTILSLEGNLLDSIPSHSFRTLGNLKRLNLQLNRINQLRKSGFQGLGKLLNLILRNNMISSIEEGSFEGLDSLTSLALRGNPLIIMAELSHLLQIRQIYLELCLLEIIPGPIFKIKTDVRQVFMNKNNISEIHQSAFAFMENTTLLNLQVNKLTTKEICGSVWLPLKNLKHLYLDNNAISFISSYCFSNLYSLRTLILGRNKITHVNKNAFAGMSYLENLSLEHNKVHHLTNASFRGLGNLRDLSLASNQIERIEKSALRYLDALEYLILWGNALVSVEGLCYSEEQNLTNVRTLDLSSNKVLSIPPGCFDHLVSLERLYLHGNNISDLDANVFKGLAVLEVLFLDHNRMQVVRSGVFNGLNNLRLLDLSYNYVHTIESQAFSALLMLVELGLQENALLKISPDVFPVNCTTSCSLIININSLICNCSYSWIVNEMNFSPRSKIDCIQPTAKTKKKVDRLADFTTENCIFDKTSDNEFNSSLLDNNTALVLDPVHRLLLFAVAGALVVALIIIFAIHKRQSIKSFFLLHCVKHQSVAATNNAEADTPC